MAGTWSGWLARVVDVRPGERRALLLSTALFFAVLSSYYLIRGLRDELGVLQGVENLPELWIWTAAASLAAHPVIGWAVARLPRRVFVPLAFRVALACVLAAFVAFVRAAPEEGAEPSARWLLAARAFYVGVSVWAMVSSSLFWSLMADVWRAEQGKRLFGFIATGGTIGGMAGSAVMTVFALLSDPLWMLLFCAALLEVCARAGARVVALADADAAATGRGEPERIGGGVLAGLAEVARSPYLLAFAAFLLLLTFANAFVYNQTSAILDERVQDGDVRTAIFSGMDLATNALTLLGQGWLAAWIVRRLGAGALLAALPLCSLIGFGVIAIAPVVPAVVLLRVLQTAGRHAFVRPGRTLLFTVLSRSERYKAQNFCDVVLYRAGDAGSAAVYDQLADPEEGLGLGVASTATVALVACAGMAGVALGLGRAFDRRVAAAEAAESGPRTSDART